MITIRLTTRRGIDPIPDVDRTLLANSCIDLGTDTRLVWVECKHSDRSAAEGLAPMAIAWCEQILEETRGTDTRLVWVECQH